MAKKKEILNKTNIIKMCTRERERERERETERTKERQRERERVNTKWRFYKLENLTVLAVLLKDVPLNSSVLPEALLKNGTLKCPTFDESTTQPYNDIFCLFRSPAFPLHANHMLAGASQKFNLFISRVKYFKPIQFKGVHVNDLPIVWDLRCLKI